MKLKTLDSLTSLTARMGNNDKLNNTFFDLGKNLSGQQAFRELYAMYSENWIAGKIVDIVADDITREFIEITDNIDAEQIDKLTDKMDKINVKESFRNAIKLSRIFGTAYILLKIDDGLEDDQPVDFDKVKGVEFMKTLDPLLLKPSMINKNDQSFYYYTTDPYSDNFGFPEYYEFATYLQNDRKVIHHSRLLRFDAIKVPFEKLREQNFIADSVLKRCYKAIRNFTLSTDTTANSIFSANVDVMKIENLRAILSNPSAEENFIKQQELSKQMESVNSVKIMDKNDDLVVKNATFSGLAQTLEAFSLHLSSASDVPATKLFGSSASGLNATGEGDRQNYQNSITTKQQEIKPHITTLFKLFSKELGLDENNISFEFVPLEKMTDIEIADLQLKNAQRDQVYLQNNIISETTVAKQLKNDLVYNSIDDDIEEIEKGLRENEQLHEIDPIAKNSQQEEKGEE